MAWVQHDHVDAAALAKALADSLHRQCQRALAQRGRALLALAGGSTPLPAYRALAGVALDWRSVTAMPTDERCVPHEHAACNLRALRAALAAAPGVTLESLTAPDGTCAASLPAARAMLARHPAAFDAVLLGMGEDGHTASLFPGAHGLCAALDPTLSHAAVRIDPEPAPPDAPFARITLTASRLLHARCVILALTGQAKRAVLEQALAGNDQQRHPVAAILHAPGSTVHVHWSP
ncbi:6-phosphogluconolactonase [Lysobacter sp. A3-1-A15]|uniref:6-phosphogluconolactonase n=1 Tax=Novilysobacter viscosus TaxID=3098602 RepID=UPI002EDAC491